jgi:tetratricopeptide (TPR) repeat protein
MRPMNRLVAGCWAVALRRISSASLLIAALALPAAAGTLGVGAFAPPLELSDLGGAARNVSWGDGAPAATIVYFFDPQTPDCLLLTSFLDAVYARARDFGLAVYAVEARGRQPAEVTRSMERYCRVYRAPGFPVLPDPTFRTGRTFGVDAVPVTFIMESHGVILNRIEGYGPAAAVTIARRVEQLLRRDRGHLTPSLRESGISEAEEVEAEARIAAASAARAAAPAARALGAGDRAPELEFTDLAGRTSRWSWGSAEAKGVRIIAFFGGLALASIEELTWLDALSRRGRDAGLEVLAVEAGGMSAAELQSALEKYRRYNAEPSFPVVPDAEARLTKTFGPWEQLPQTFLVAADGAILYHAEGFGAGEAEIIAGKVERAYLLAGRPFPPVLSPAAAASEAAPPPVEEEAPSLRRAREQGERYRSSIVEGDAAFMAWEFERALTRYPSALEAQPRELHALVRAAQIYERRADPEHALEMWERVLAVRPDHVEAGIRTREMRRSR